MSTPAAGEERDERLPDLAIAPLEDFRIDVRGDGRRLLRFSATIVNIGEAPLEVVGRRVQVISPRMRVTQRIAGPEESYERPIGATMTYSGDGHDHWHVDNVMQYDLWSEDGEYRSSQKTGFCFWDNREHDLSLSGAPPLPVYPASLCGDATSIHNSMGLSVGWGDRYRHTLAWQWIDITGVPDGQYVVRAVADPVGHFYELDLANNCTWARVELSGDDVSQIAAGSECTPPPSGVEPRLAAPPLMARTGCALLVTTLDAEWESSSSARCARFR